MSKVWIPFILISLFVLIFSCGEDNPLAFAEKDLIGVWNTLKDEFTNKNDQFEKVDLLKSADTDSILFTFTENGELKHKTIFSDGNVLRLTNDNSFYDFDNDGTSESASETIELEKLLN